MFTFCASPETFKWIKSRLCQLRLCSLGNGSRCYFSNWQASKTWPFRLTLDYQTSIWFQILVEDIMNDFNYVLQNAWQTLMVWDGTRLTKSSHYRKKWRKLSKITCTTPRGCIVDATMAISFSGTNKSLLRKLIQCLSFFRWIVSFYCWKFPTWHNKMPIPVWLW